MTEAAVIEEMMILRFRRKIPTDFLSVLPDSSSFCYISINIIWQWCSQVLFCVSFFSRKFGRAVSMYFAHVREVVEIEADQC